MSNPFSEVLPLIEKEGKVWEASDWLGRGALMEEIWHRLHGPNPSSICLWGPRCIGKSFFLHMLRHRLRAHSRAQTGKAQGFADRIGMGSDAPLVVHVDLRGGDGARDRELLTAIAGQVADEVSVLDPGIGAELRDRSARIAEERDLGEIHARFRDVVIEGLREWGGRLVILLDGFDKATRHLDGASFDLLRSLASRHPVTYVTASRNPLSTVCPPSLTSGFSNIFVPVEVGCMTDSDGTAYVLAMFAEAQQSVARGLVEQLVESCGGHPYLVRIASFHLFEAIRGGQDPDPTRILRQAERECGAALRHSLSDFQPREVTLLADDGIRVGGAGPASGRLHRMRFLTEDGVVRSSLVQRLAAEVAGPLPTDGTSEQDRVWKLIQCLESNLRKLVEHCYREHYGDHWEARVRKNLPVEERQVVDELHQREKARRACWSNAESIRFLDLTHLRQMEPLVCKEWAIFRHIFKEKREFVGMLHDVVPTRNALAHNRDQPRLELMRAEVAVRDLLRLLRPALRPNTVARPPIATSGPSAK